MHTVLIVEDEPEIRNYLDLALKLHGLEVEFAESGEDVIALVTNNQIPYSLVLLDVFSPIRDGIGSLKAIQQLRPDLPVIMMSASATPGNVITAMTHGARDFLAKPIGHEELKDAIEKVLNVKLPLPPPETAEQMAQDAGSFAFTGAWSKKIAMLLERVASSDVPVLLQGETGVGKEVLARALHARSRRSGRPFLKLNCAALPSELVESELFGYEKGAFTGAFKNTPGKFELANGGTIFLDEIGDMDVKLQAKLLQVLQDQEFHRLGAKETTQVDVRVMAASHCDFDKAIREGRFREDLYYRLNIIDVHIPPLRERTDEILPLAEVFINKHTSADCPKLLLTTVLKQALLEHTWPGNVRELENTMQKYLVLRNSELLTEDIRRRQRKGKNTNAISIDNAASASWENSPDLAHGTISLVAGTASSTTAVASAGELKGSSAYAASTVPPKSLPAFSDPHGSMDKSSSLLSNVQNAHRAAEAEAILSALNTSLWNRKQAANLLNIDYKALLYKMKKLGIGEKPIPAGSWERPSATKQTSIASAL